jgi:hypothetical protein
VTIFYLLDRLVDGEAIEERASGSDRAREARAGEWRAPGGTEMADDVQVANRRLDASGNEALIGTPRRSPA